MTHLMGLDISTTGAKALIIDAGGAVKAVAQFPAAHQPAAAAVERAKPRRLVGRHAPQHSTCPG